MEHGENHREHYNLYHIFEADKVTHPMAPDTANKIRENILKNFSQNIKPFGFPIPPD